MILSTDGEADISKSNVRRHFNYKCVRGTDSQNSRNQEGELEIIGSLLFIWQTTRKLRSHVNNSWLMQDMSKVSSELEHESPDG